MFGFHDGELLEIHYDGRDAVMRCRSPRNGVFRITCRDAVGILTPGAHEPHRCLHGASRSLERAVPEGASGETPRAAYSSDEFVQVGCGDCGSPVSVLFRTDLLIEKEL